VTAEGTAFFPGIPESRESAGSGRKTRSARSSGILVAGYSDVIQR
jgi:hypothetical protein